VAVRDSANPVLARARRWLDQVNARHPWDHNEHFHGWILRNLPACRRAAVDIGRDVSSLHAGRRRPVEVTGFQVCEDRGVQCHGADFRIGQPGKKRHHLIHHGAGPVEVPGPEGYIGDGLQRGAAKLEVAQPFGDRQGRPRGGFRSGCVVLGVYGQRGECVALGEGALLGEVQGLLDPPSDEGPFRVRLPAGLTDPP
jgi:hypothetical protein